MQKLSGGFFMNKLSREKRVELEESSGMSLEEIYNFCMRETIHYDYALLVINKQMSLAEAKELTYKDSEAAANRVTLSLGTNLTNLRSKMSCNC